MTPTETRPGAAPRRLSRGLLTLNAALLALLAAVTLAPDAGAQGGGRLRGTYALVAGEADGSPDNVAYILDSTNQELLAVRWAATTGAQGDLEVIGARSLTQDQQARPGR